MLQGCNNQSHNLDILSWKYHQLHLKKRTYHQGMSSSIQGANLLSYQIDQKDTRYMLKNLPGKTFR